MERTTDSNRVTLESQETVTGESKGVYRQHKLSHNKNNEVRYGGSHMKFV